MSPLRKISKPRVTPLPSKNRGPDLAGGTPLKSYEAVGAWFRVVIPAGKEEIAIIGFIASNEVEILEEKTTPRPDFWAPPPPGTFLGLGFDIVLGGGFTNFGSGNLAAGVRGMSDEPAERIQRMGNTLLERESGPFRSAVHASADILYNLGPRLAVGIGGDLIKARKSFKIAPVPGGPSRAFQIGAYQLYPSVTNQFPEKEKVSLFFQLYGLPRAIRDGGEVEATISQEGQEAVLWSERALTFRGNVVEVLNALGECRLTLGRKDQALKAWTRSLEISPNQEAIKKKIASIRNPAP